MIFLVNDCHLNVSPVTILILTYPTYILLTDRLPKQLFSDPISVELNDKQKSILNDIF